MRRTRTLAIVVGALVQIAASPSPPVARCDLGDDGHVEQIALQGTTIAVALEGKSLGEVRAPVADPSVLGPGTLAIVDAGDLHVAHARWPFLDGKHAAEVVLTVDEGKLLTIFAGVTGPVGRDAERAEALRVDGRGVLRYQTAPGVTRCDGDDVLFPERWDVEAARFRPVAIAPPTGEALSATATIPGDALAPSLRLFRWTATSSRAGDGGTAEGLRAPIELGDGDPKTAWYEGAGGWGRGAWVTATARAPSLVVRGVLLSRAPGNLLRAVTLFVGDARWTVTLPRGERLWIALPSPRPARCVTLAIADASDGGSGAATGLAEAAIVTTLDGPDAISELARAVAHGGPGVDGLATALGELGAAAAPAIAAELHAATGDGRARLLRVLVDGGSAEAAAPLVAALADSTERETRWLADELHRKRATPLGRAAGPLLIALALDETKGDGARSAAIGILAADSAALLTLTEAFLEGKLTRPRVRRALVRALAEGDPRALLPLIARDLASGHSRSAVEEARLVGLLAARARASGDSALIATAAEAVRAAWPATTLSSTADADDFALRFVLLRAARALAVTSLRELVEAGASSTWAELRWAGVEAAIALVEGAGRPIVLRALVDPDPRVRAAALAGLVALHDRDLAPRAAQALADGWPLVRVQAAQALAESCPLAAADALVHAVDDRSTDVRIAAMGALASCAPTRAGTIAVALVARPRVSPLLRETAATIAERLAPREAAPAIASALEEVLDDPLSDERAAFLAVALVGALDRLADPRAEPALLRAATEPPAPSLRAAAIGALAHLCTPAARHTIAAAQHDPEAVVQRAAASAVAICH